MISKQYSNNLTFPIYGFGAKTNKNATTQSDIFPLTKDLRNPFISNDPKAIDDAYFSCLKDLELSSPIKLSPLFETIKTLGQLVKKQSDSTLSDNPSNLTYLQNFYVVYILSAGLIDDL